MALDVALAMLQRGDRWLMQLRDDIPGIVAPGCWGLFGGHLDPGETPEQAPRRELLADISWQPPQLCVWMRHHNQRWLAHIVWAELSVPLEHWRLLEGQGMVLVSVEAPRLDALASRLVRMARRETGTAYLLWCASLLGVCGLQRFYLGQALVGTLYLLTFGFCGVAQLIDLFLIPGLVERSNQADARLRWLRAPVEGTALGTGADAASQPGLEAVSPVGRPREPVLTLEQQILRRCEHEPASLAQFILATGEPSESIRKVVEEMAAQGLLRQTISDSGSLLYQLH